MSERYVTIRTDVTSSGSNPMCHMFVTLLVTGERNEKSHIFFEEETYLSSTTREPGPTKTTVAIMTQTRMATR
jgi:hypothetical protein